MPDIAGYVTTDIVAPYTPSEGLSRFLESAESPILVLLDTAQLKNPDDFLQTLKETSLKYGVHILLDSKFQIFRCTLDIPTIFVLDSVPLGKYINPNQKIDIYSSLIAYSKNGSCPKFRYS